MPIITAKSRINVTNTKLKMALINRPRPSPNTFPQNLITFKYHINNITNIGTEEITYKAISLTCPEIGQISCLKVIMAKAPENMPTKNAEITAMIENLDKIISPLFKFV